MIKTYNYNDRVQISTHFNSSEFRCKCSKAHSYKIDTELINKLEELRSKLNCSKIIITSGYRCSSHDKNVGGSGKGQHTLGNACDCILYDKNGKVISTKIVSCKAQDIGFRGIANITKDYSYIHLDVRSSGRYYGNEIYGTYTVTNDFYKYYGIPRENKFNLTRLLKKGCKGNDVKKLQEELIKRGYSVGKYGADGILGNDSSKAIAKFQKDNNLVPDKIVGRDTAHKLGWTYQGK